MELSEAEEIVAKLEELEAGTDDNILQRDPRIVHVVDGEGNPFEWVDKLSTLPDDDQYAVLLTIPNPHRNHGLIDGEVLRILVEHGVDDISIADGVTVIIPASLDPDI